MSHFRFQRYLLLSVLFIVAAACAKVSAPTGGLRDRKPPVALKSVPENGAKNFSGKSVTITFDEYVTLDNINEKFMVSPPMKKKPRVLTRGKGVVVEFEEKLKDSTTYTFYFLDAIRDLNEGNILDNFQFVFSTGNIIDSLSVTGQVFRADNLEVPEKVQVMMYKDMSDSAVIKDLPDYISRVDANGYFRIDNIREGKYRLFGLKDADNSKNYNSILEEFAFLDSTIIVTSARSFIPVIKDTTTNKAVLPVDIAKLPSAAPIPEAPVLKSEYRLLLFLANKKDHYLSGSSRDTKNLLTYTLSLPPDTMKVEFSIPDTDIDKYFLVESRKRDTLKVWLTDSTLYSQALVSTLLRYPFTDTLGVLGYKTDTISMRFVAPRPTRGVKLLIPQMKVINNLTGGTIKPGAPITFSTEAPFREPDTSRIHIYELADTNKINVPYQLVIDETTPGKLVMNAKLTEEKKYLLITDTAAFSNILNENSDSAGIRFSVRKPDSYGKLILNITNCQGPSIIQLLSNAEKLLGEKKIDKDGKVEFPLLDNGFYRIRVIYDLNGDGEWTTGDYMTGRQPEPISYYEKELEIKSGWDDIEDWSIKLRNYKDQKLRAKPKAK